jgi:hypothetical protein
MYFRVHGLDRINIHIEVSAVNVENPSAGRGVPQVCAGSGRHPDKMKFEYRTIEYRL